MTLDSLDSPRPGLEGSHHLPPYSILYVAPRHPHPNGFYSRDSQGGDSKLSRFGLSGLWEFITPGSDLGLGWGLKKTCSSPQELSNSLSHSICTQQDRVNSQLFVIGSQTPNLTTGPSFAHNLCCRCSNGSCEAIFDICTLRPFQRYKAHLKASCFFFYCWALKLRESRRTPNSHFWECESHPHTCLKVGLRQYVIFCQTTIGVVWTSIGSKCGMETDWFENLRSMQWNCSNLLIYWIHSLNQWLPNPCLGLVMDFVNQQKLLLVQVHMLWVWNI